MKILLTSILLFYVCHSKAQKTLISEEDAYNFNMHKVLTKNAKRLEKMKFSKAVKKMGKPFEIEKYHHYLFQIRCLENIFWNM